MRKERLNMVIFAISIVCSVVALIYLPEVLPSYIDSEGKITRYATKYEKVLLYPTLTIMVEGLLDFIQKRLFDEEHKYIAGFFKTYFIFFFTFENIKFLLNAFNIHYLNSIIVTIVTEVVIFIISWKYNKKQRYRNIRKNA